MYYLYLSETWWIPVNESVHKLIMSQLLFCKGFSSFPPQWVKGALSSIKHSIFFTFPIYQIFWKIDCHVLTSNQHNRKYCTILSIATDDIFMRFLKFVNFIYIFIELSRECLVLIQGVIHEQNKIHILLKWLKCVCFWREIFVFKIPCFVALSLLAVVWSPSGPG